MLTDVIPGARAAVRSEPIPLSRPDLGGNEEVYVADAIRSTWISSSGKYVSRFEKEFSAACRTGHAISVTNGTGALHLALAGFGVAPGDEVIVPSLTYVATANAVRYLGATPVFAEVDPDTWCIDPAKIESLITAKTKGIVAVHLYGHPADMDAINDLATRYGLWTIEDAAQAHFARYKGTPVGGLGRAATFSFYGNKIVASGEGGAITLNDSDLARKLRQLRGQGADPERDYHFPVVGYNYRLTNVACALLCAQLERAAAILHRRAEIFELYRERLASVAGLGLQPAASWARPAPWLFCVTVDEKRFGRSRDALRLALHRAAIETRPFFLPVHTLPAYREKGAMPLRTLPITERLSAQGMNLPCYPGLSNDDAHRIADAIVAAR